MALRVFRCGAQNFDAIGGTADMIANTAITKDDLVKVRELFEQSGRTADAVLKWCCR
jgi:hypothetical protein